MVSRERSCWVRVGMAWPAMERDIARSERGARLKGMGSLTAMEPGGMVIGGVAVEG